MNDVRALRDRQQAARERMDRATPWIPEGAAAVLAQTTTVTAYPTTASAYFACVPVDIDGDETEGATATYVPRNSPVFFAWNAGAQAPPAGAAVVCHGVGGRWVFRYDG